MLPSSGNCRQTSWSGATYTGWASDNRPICMAILHQGGSRSRSTERVLRGNGQPETDIPPGVQHPEAHGRSKPRPVTTLKPRSAVASSSSGRSWRSVSSPSCSPAGSGRSSPNSGSVWQGRLSGANSSTAPASRGCESCRQPSGRGNRVRGFSPSGQGATAPGASARSGNLRLQAQLPRQRRDQVG